jgi:demethylmenaquinone methyltransferase / 2-methoxy-6-polyprenyl-1,4-benzoquinol methylase
MSRASLSRQPDDVSRIFDQTARRYYGTNTILSRGRDRYWAGQSEEAQS